MLNKSERYQVLKTWNLICVLLVGQFPFEVDLDNWRLKVAKTKKLWIWVVSYILYGIHALFITSTLVYNWLCVPDFQLHQLVIHAVMALSSVTITFWHFWVYVLDPGFFSKYAKWTLVGNVGGTPDLNDGLNKHWKRRMREYSMQDLIAKSLPYTLVTTAALIGIIDVYDPSMSILLYNYLPTCLKNWATFAFLMVEELRFLMVHVTAPVPIWQLQIISFDLVRNRLQALKKNIENGRVTPRSAYTILRSLQLYVSYFNIVNRYMIFTWKLLSISVAILTGFSAVAHFYDYPIFGLMYYIMLFDCVFFYTIKYEKAFKIPELFDETASRALLCLGGTRRDRFRKQISSIQPTAITVGRFHKMERTSTLIYMNFVATNIVSMLVAFG